MSACAATLASTAAPAPLRSGCLSLRIDRLENSRAASQDCRTSTPALVARSSSLGRGRSKDVERAWIPLDTVSLARISGTKFERL
jgi:hypothetical protein